MKRKGKSARKSRGNSQVSSATQRLEMDQLLKELAAPSNSSIAIVLGAGASQPFGYPLTRQLMLNILLGLPKKELLERPKGAHKLLYDFLCELLPGERASQERVPLVTGVLSLLDHALASGQGILPRRTLEETRHMRELLERAIVESIPDWQAFEAHEEELFDSYCDWLKQLLRVRPGNGLALITTNYDMIADLAALKVAGVDGDYAEWDIADMATKVDFGFRWVRPDLDKETAVGRPANPLVSLFKLHGSTNWLRCPLCENLYVNPNAQIVWNTFEKETTWAVQCHCSKTRLESQIVSPSFVRQMREPNLIAIWKSALDVLRTSDYWVMIGYGFPDEDVAVRALFARAFRSRAQPPKIRVVQWGTDAEINYESFFQQGSLRYLTGGLGRLLERWKVQRKSLSPK